MVSIKLFGYLHTQKFCSALATHVNNNFYFQNDTESGPRAGIVKTSIFSYRVVTMVTDNSQPVVITSVLW